MLKRSFLPLNLQLFADGEGDGGAGAPQGGAQGHQQPSGNQGGQSIEQIVATAMAAVEARQQRAGDSVVKSLAEQYGMSADELKILLKTEQDKKKQMLSPEAQAQVDAANDKLKKYQLNAEVAKLGAAMGLVDADVAITLLDSKAIVYKDDGTIEGVQKALDGLKEKKPYLFQTQKPQGGSWGQGRQGGAPDSEKPTTLRSALMERYKK